MLLEQFQADRALPGDHGVVIEGMHKGEVLCLAAADGLFVSLVVVGAVQNHVGAIAARRRDLDERRGQRHANLGADAELAGVVGHALGVISGRGRDHALGTFFGAQREQLVQRAALFESAGSLQVVELQIDLVGGGLGKRLRTRAGRKVDGVANAAQGRLDVVESDHFPIATAICKDGNILPERQEAVETRLAASRRRASPSHRETKGVGGNGSKYNLRNGPFGQGLGPSKPMQP